MTRAQASRSRRPPWAHNDARDHVHVGESPESVDALEAAEANADVLLDFRAFCACLSITPMEAEGGAVRFTEWHPEQLDFDRRRTGRDIVLKSRKVGITTLEFARDLQFAVTRENVNVLIIGHDAALIEEAFIVIHKMVACLVERGLIHPPLGGESKRSIIWRPEHGGSAIRITEAGETDKFARKKGRSATVHRLHLTETSYYGAADATFSSVTNSLAKNAEVVNESTANGLGNRFHSDVKRAREGKLEGYTFHFWPWFTHPSYELDPSPGFDFTPQNEWEEHLRGSVPPANYLRKLAWMRWKISDLGGGAAGLERFLRDFPPSEDAAFRATGGNYLSGAAADAIAALVRAPLEKRELTWQGRRLAEAWIYSRPRPLHEYVVPCDPADGGGCLAAAVVMDRRTGEHCAVVADRGLDSGDLGICAALLAREYNEALLAPERNTGQATIRSARNEAGYHRIFQAADGKLGWHTGADTRAVMWDDLRRGAESRDEDGKPTPEWTTPDVRLADEARALIVGPDGKPMHGPGGTDDIWTCVAIGTQLRLRVATKSGDAAPPKGSEAKRAMGRPTRARDLAY